MPLELGHGGLMSAERDMWDANLERGTLELRHKQILVGIDILSSMMTQATLVAGAAVSSLGGESLETLNVSDNTVLRERAEARDGGSKRRGARGNTFVRRGARRRSAPPCTLFLVLCVTRDV